LFDDNQFRAPLLVEAQPHWALQGVMTLVGDALAIFYNHPLHTGENFELLGRWLRKGKLGPARVISSSAGWKGYLASAAELPADTEAVPCLWADTPNEKVGGQVSIGYLERETLP
jgi:hypothetical protein